MTHRRIFKYDLTMGPTTLRLPAGYRILAFGMQEQGPVIWAEVDPLRLTVEAAFDIFPTGYSIPDGGSWIGSVQDGPFVWHLYQIP